MNCCDPLSCTLIFSCWGHTRFCSNCKVLCIADFRPAYYEGSLLTCELCKSFAVGKQTALISIYNLAAFVFVNNPFLNGENKYSNDKAKANVTTSDYFHMDLILIDENA